MPKTPKGAHKRPADVISNAVHVMPIATGEIEEAAPSKSAVAVELGRKGSVARAKSIKKHDRIRIAKEGAVARWGKKRPS
jgi:hypothetical protein